MGRRGRKAKEEGGPIDPALAAVPPRWRPPEGWLALACTSHLLGVALGLGVGLLVAAWLTESAWLFAPALFLASCATLQQLEFCAAAGRAESGAPLAEEAFPFCWDIDLALALPCPWLEYFARTLAYPEGPAYSSLWAAGIALMFVGQGVHLLSLVTSRTTLTMVDTSASIPSLCVSGIYRWVRHPAHFGLFWWGVGGQLLLHNPLCLTAFLWYGWRHVRDRIRAAEAQLLQAHGEQYASYRQHVGTGIPGIR